MEKYFESLDELAKWAASHEIDVISIDAHKCLSVNGTVKYGLSCIARGEDKPVRGQFNSNKYSDPSLIDDEASRMENKLRSYGFTVSRATRPV